MSRTSKALRGALLAAPKRDLCLDFANSRMYRGSGSDAQETLHDFTALATWCEAAFGAHAEERARRWAEKDPENAAEVFSNAIAIREAMYRIFFAMATRKTPEARDVAAVNRALDEAPARRVLLRGENGFGWRIDINGISAASLLAPVLWSAGDLMVSPDTARLRHCSNDKCLWLFLDDSKNGSRRWCSMQSCGNRAKAHRHYLRTKGD